MTIKVLLLYYSSAFLLQVFLFFATANTAAVHQNDVLFDSSDFETSLRIRSHRQHSIFYRLKKDIKNIFDGRDTSPIRTPTLEIPDPHDQKASLQERRSRETRTDPYSVDKLLHATSDEAVRDDEDSTEGSGYIEHEGSSTLTDMKISNQVNSETLAPQIKGAGSDDEDNGEGSGYFEFKTSTTETDTEKSYDKSSQMLALPLDGASGDDEDNVEGSGYFEHEKTTTNADIDRSYNANSKILSHQMDGAADYDKNNTKDVPGDPDFWYND